MEISVDGGKTKGGLIVWGNFAQNPKELPPLVWAYVGDAVFELYVRLHLVKQGLVKVDKLHSKASSLVNAVAQADFLHQLEDMLTEEETYIVRRGRNTKSHVPKNVGVSEYRLSTGFEALIGYLFLSGAEMRLEEIITYLLSRNEGELGG
ncbi:MAG: ribonuclease III domain-containing protein [Clostridia bacterium]|nr:ribonuclease III domain-containing protein [Clostridia bacterium]MDD4146798.1 ribonuclease III domain-containing protein [Clostridia bacterium]MDD4665576.1 ribonuclease III domain-containing protein [Clostridia bacterium]